MTQTSAPEKGQPDELARLRDRTDEIELIISGLTILALFTLPGWLFENLVDRFTHLSVSLSVGGSLATVLITGLCYVLGACFVVHLLARAYWIGLIGLRTVFPGGINWARTPGIGPQTRAYYRSHLPDLPTAITRADRFASSLFAVISLVALSFLWIGALMVLTLLASGLIGAQFGATNRGLNIGFLLLLVVGAGVPLLAWLLDGQLGARFPRLAASRWFAGFVLLLIRITSVLYPQRLVLPVQLTLQSNTRPVIFIVFLFLSVVGIMVVGQARWEGWRQFTLSGEFRYMQSDVLDSGIRSGHYEEWRSPKDRMRPWPMITAFEQRGDHVRLFLPYWPVRDNLMLDKLCAAGSQPPGHAACMQLIWGVRINGREVDLSGFLPTERMDLGLRGLLGVVPMNDLQPGLHLIEVTWNPLAEEADTLIDDRYDGEGRLFHIPFQFAPQYELELPERDSLPIATDPAP